MSVREKKRKNSNIFTGAAIAAGLGMGVTMLLLVLAAALIHNGSIGAGGRQACVVAAVFVGCLIASVCMRRLRCGFVVQTLLLTAAYAALILVLSAMQENGALVGAGFVPSVLSAAGGSALGAVTNFSKSYKSYKRNGCRG